MSHRRKLRGRNSLPRRQKGLHQLPGRDKRPVVDEEENESLKEDDEGDDEGDDEVNKLKSEVANLESRLRVKCDKIDNYARLRKKDSSEYEDLKSKALELESKLARTSAQLATARGNHQAPSSIVTAARACNQDGSDRAPIAQARLGHRGTSTQARARRHYDIGNGYCTGCGDKLRDDGYCDRDCLGDITGLRRDAQRHGLGGPSFP